MAEVVLFHGGRGLRRGVTLAAERLGEAGHVVHVPDYYDGEVFDDLADGMAKRDALGMEEIVRRAHAAVEDLPETAVLAGFSLGAMLAQLLAAARPATGGAILMHGAQRLEVLGIDRWPEQVPADVHYGAGDDLVDPQTVLAFGAVVTAAGARFDAYAYPCSGHLFADPDLPDYHHESAELMWERVDAFLARADAT
jgi:dienelactone hydrolase